MKRKNLINEVKKMRIWSKPSFILFILLLVTSFSGCGGGGGGGSVETSPTEPLLEGIFVDSPVEGLDYETPTRTGITDGEGTFLYHEGDMVRFYVGDIMLGEAIGKSIMTPIDLVVGATDINHPAVINMARFLQTMDDDMNPENGITISQAMSDAMIGHTINFNMDPVDFEYDPNVMMALEAMNEIDMSAPYREMVSVEDARNHMSITMGNMMGSESQGIFVDSPVEGLEYENSIRTGITDENGTFHYYEGDMIRFYVGSIELGEAPAKSIMTPIDLVEGATDQNHPAVINMVRFLQTLDEDMDPENGITITEAMSDAMLDHMIDFDMDPDQFGNDPDVMMMMDTVNEFNPSSSMRTMVSTEDALDHFNSTINDMMNDDSTMMDDEENHMGS